jgi:sulfoxide reductase heme-binding subunit YedZ
LEQLGLNLYLVAASASSTGPSWYWYTTRGFGIALLVVLTATVVLGIGTAMRWTGEATPGFVAAGLHRNLSLLAIVLLAGHILTTVLDPYAKITVRDAIIPLGAAYRPVWLGLGVVAAEILVAVAATSLLRNVLGPKTWRLIHWAAYGSWPLAVVHGLGTGSDAQAPWMIGVVVSCVAAVILALAARLWGGRISTVPLRLAAAATAAMTLAIGSTWAVQGPLQLGWAAKAGTPTVPSTAKPKVVHPGPGGFSDPLAGFLVRDTAGNTQISMRDMVDTGLTIAVRSPTKAETLPVVAIARDGRSLCNVPATAGQTLYAVCGDTRLTITLTGAASATTSGGQIGGQLVTSGPLR